MESTLDSCLDFLDAHSITIYDLIIRIFEPKSSKHQHRKDNLMDKAANIVDIFIKNEAPPVLPVPAPITSLSPLWAQIFTTSTNALVMEMGRLTDARSGFHAGASQIKLQQLEALSLVSLFDKMSSLAPLLTRLVTTLLDAHGERRRWLRTTEMPDAAENIINHLPDDDYTELLKEFEDFLDDEEFAEELIGTKGQSVEGSSEARAKQTKRQRLTGLRNNALIRIVRKYRPSRAKDTDINFPQRKRLLSLARSCRAPTSDAMRCKARSESFCSQSTHPSE